MDFLLLLRQIPVNPSCDRMARWLVATLRLLAWDYPRKVDLVGSVMVSGFLVFEVNRREVAD
jgi:hypothetical protein